ncbi:MAG: hypothetical protein LC135_09675 [Phycisphaerae bacterium]|nr:hypothetical protein [Phycisphaerae bacterium]MCZ2400118.1 hypothetical protein [Phycisphaerae bacterium]
MKTFTDNAGRTWTISITVDAIKRVEGLIKGVNLANLTDGDPPLLTRLETDVVLLCDVIFALVKPQAEQVGVSDEEFGRAMGGDAIMAAHDAFWEELTGFFRQLRRTDTARAIEKQAALVKATVEAIEQRVERFDTSAVIEKALGGSAGNSPELPASIPDR